MRSYWNFLKNNWGLVAFGFLAVFWGNFGQSFFIGWYGEAIKQSLNLSAQQYGLIYSLATLASAAAMVWLGGLIDRWSLRQFLALVSVGLALAALLMSLAFNVVLLCLGFFLLRLFGQALFPHMGITTMARYFERQRGMAVSLAATGVSVGEVVLPVAAVVLMQSLGWQLSWLLIAASVPLMFVPTALFLLSRVHWPLLPQDDEPESVRKKQNSGTKVLLRDRRFWFAAPTAMSVPFCLTAIFIQQDFVLTEKGWTLQWMATCFMFYGVVHWFSSIFFGVLVDRFSGLTLLRFFSLPVILALLATANFQGPWVAMVMMGFLGLAVGASGPVLSSLWAEIYGARILGGIRATAGALMVFSTAVSPVAFGWFIDQGVSITSLFNGVALGFIACLGLLWFSYRRPEPNSHAPHRVRHLP